MPAEILTAGYQSLRDHIESDWDYVELRATEGGVVWERLKISTDPRCVWTHAPGAQELEVTITLAGDDADMTLPETFAESVLYDVAVAGSELAKNTFTSATLSVSSDQLVIKHKIQVPQSP